MQEACQFTRPATCWNYEASLRLVGVALPAFGHRCPRSDDAEAGRDRCASQSAGAADIALAVAFGMCIAVMPLWRNVNGHDG